MIFLIPLIIIFSTCKMKKIPKNLNEELNRMKSLFTEERLYGNLSEQTYTWDDGGDTVSNNNVVTTEPHNTSYLTPNTKTIKKIIDNNNNSEVFKKGDEGYGVKEIKNYLKEYGYDIDLSESFDNKMENIVKEFQRDRNIKVDGIVGIETSLELVKEKKDKKNIKHKNVVPLTDDIIIDITNKIISNMGKSKKYETLTNKLHNITRVGILDFAKGGLSHLYKAMDTEKYFGKSEEEMINSIKVYDGKELEDEEWKKNMKKFLSSNENKEVQNKAVLLYHIPKIKKIIGNKEMTIREYAIIMSISNTSNSLLKNLNKKYKGNFENMMEEYCSKKCRTRCRILNDYYPNTNQDKDFVYKGCV